jgi:hypothetical protein
LLGENRVLGENYHKYRMDWLILILVFLRCDGLLKFLLSIPLINKNEYKKGILPYMVGSGKIILG